MTEAAEPVKKNDIVQGDCPKCGPERYADIVSQHSVNWRDEDEKSGLWSDTDYRILSCRGCGVIYFQIDRVFSEDEAYDEDPITGEYVTYHPHNITHWPEPDLSRRSRPCWVPHLEDIDQDLGSLLDDIYGTLDNNLCVPAAIAIRTAFDRASELLDVDPAVSFEEKLDELLARGKIGTDEKETFDILTNAGSAAAHRGWKPKLSQLETMVTTGELHLKQFDKSI